MLQNGLKGGAPLSEQISNRYDLKTWGFLQTGWWILHIVAIVLVFYLGYLFGPEIFAR